MGVRINEIVVDSLDPHRLAEFWCAVLDYGWSSTPTTTRVEVRPAGTARPDLARAVAAVRSGA